MNIGMQFLKSWIYNIKTILLGIKYPRDESVWIFGSWMGNRFADNSRFLFQYVDSAKEKYGLSHVVWATSNSLVYEELKSLGYEVVKNGTPEAILWHLRAGVHVICNNANSIENDADIMTQYSFGAKKLQLWHGVGIKACSGLKGKRRHTLKEKVYDLIKKYGMPGMWGLCFFLATGRENARVAEADLHIEKKRILIGGYARLCDCVQYTFEEKKVINIINSYKNKGYKIVLYLPTFRGDGTKEYPSPHNIDGVDTFCKTANVLWIEKKHSADKIKDLDSCSTNVMSLNSDFDINVLFDYLDLIITDYSSVSSDAIYKDIPTLEYCPDYWEYQNSDRGFVNDFSLYHDADIVTDSNLFLGTMKERLTASSNLSERHIITKAFLFNEDNMTYEKILKTIIDGMKIKVKEEV